MTPARNLMTTGAVTLVLSLAGCTDDDPAAEADPTQSAEDSSTPADPRTDSATGDLMDATPLGDVPEGTALRPGRYAMSFLSEDEAPLLLVDVPSGFTAGGDPYELGDDTPFRHFDTWTVAEVATDPCGEADWVDPGPGVDDLAGALAALPVWEATRPTPIRIGGHEGVSMELNVPDRLPAACPEPLPGWRDYQGNTQGIDVGKVQPLWIVDVDGQRVMILAGYFPGAEGPGPGQVEELIAMAEGARFVVPTRG